MEISICIKYTSNTNIHFIFTFIYIRKIFARVKKTTQQDVETDSNIYDIKTQMQKHHKSTACDNYK